MRSLGKVNVLDYLRAFGFLARHPTLIIAPLLMSAILIALNEFLSLGSRGGFGGFGSLIASLLNSFGLGVSLILADQIWRRGSARFDDAWEEGRRKFVEILLAAVGFNFVQWVAQLVGGIFGPLSLVLSIAAVYFFIYTIPAAAVGGVPGLAALQISLERVQRSYANAAVLTVIYLLVSLVLEPVVVSALLPLATIPPLGLSAIGAIVKSIGFGYLALVMSKGYADVSYGRF
ncbi:MAG: hypothetical protein ACREM6_00720 [Vulcanimicrobiaceae bacterium]